MPSIPKHISVSLAGREVRRSAFGEELDDVVVISSDNVDAGNTPTWRLRPGMVLVKKTSTGEYVEADDATGDRATIPSVDSDEAPDSDWTGKVVTCKIDGVVVAEVTLGTITDVASAVADLNGAEGIAGGFVQAGLRAVADTILTIDAPGHPGKTLEVNANLATAFGAGNGVSDEGTEADYRILLEYVDVQDQNGSAVDAYGKVARLGHFKTSYLLNDTPEALATLKRRGCLFS